VGLHIECVEEIILDKIESTIRKIKLKLNNTEVSLVSDNHEYLYTILKFSNFSFHTKNTLNYFYDRTKVKLLKSNSEIKITDLKMSANKSNRLILDLHSYVFTMSEDIVYYPDNKEGNIRSVVSSEMPGTDIVLSTKELDKLIELIICICSGINRLEATDSKTYNLSNKQIENYFHSKILNLHFSDINLVVHDEVIQSEFNNIGLNVHIEEQRFIGTKIDISFSPIDVSIFAKKSTKYSSNLFVKGFKLEIYDDYKSSKTDIYFENIKLLIYDNHLIDVMKFVADFLNYILVDNVKTIHDRNVQSLPKKTKKEQCFLTFKKVVVYCYVDFTDICTIKVNDFVYNIDDYMLIPNIKIYHQAIHKVFHLKKQKILDCNKLYIKFYPEKNELDIDFGKILLNIYSFELANTILKIYFYHAFFPHWVTYHMHYKHKVDSNYKPKYVDDFAKKNKNIIKFEEIIVIVNQNNISSAAVLQTNPSLVEENVNKVDYLKSVKCNQFTLNVTNFVLKTSGFTEKKTAEEENVRRKNIDRRIICEDDGFISSPERSSRGVFIRSIRKNELEISFGTIDLLHENSKLVELRDFNVTLHETITYEVRIYK
jgi:hypothetical protein